MKNKKQYVIILISTFLIMGLIVFFASFFVPDKPQPCSAFSLNDYVVACYWFEAPPEIYKAGQTEWGVTCEFRTKAIPTYNYKNLIDFNNETNLKTYWACSLNYYYQQYNATCGAIPSHITDFGLEPEKILNKMANNQWPDCIRNDVHANKLAFTWQPY